MRIPVIVHVRASMLKYCGYLQAETRQGEERKREKENEEGNSWNEDEQKQQQQQQQPVDLANRQAGVTLRRQAHVDGRTNGSSLALYRRKKKKKKKNEEEDREGEKKKQWMN